MRFSSIPTYELTLPSSGKKIKYRPFVVKEEKVLLLALQDTNENHVINTLKDLIHSCTFESLQVDKLPSVDIEYLFIMIRNKSLGEGLELEVTCSKCEKKINVMCNLDNVQVKKVDAEKVIRLADNLVVTMRYPTLEMSLNLTELDDLQKTIEVMAKCVEFIEYDGKLFDTDELPFEEVVEFIENLTQKQLDKLDKFLETTPQVTFDDTVKCKACGHVNNIHIEGISDFFD